MSRLVILDRDGVINEDSDAFVKSPEEWNPIPGSLEAIGRLCHAGFRCVVATNQSGIARGLFDIEALHSIHEKMNHALGEAGGRLEGIFFSPYGPKDGADCRKPGTGLFEQISRRYHTSLKGVPVIGDSRRDIQAASAAGARPILVRTGNGEKTLLEIRGVDGVTIFSDLAAAADSLIAEGSPQENYSFI